MKVYNQIGQEVETIEVPEEIFGLPPNPDLIHQVVYCMMANQRRLSAHTKTRAEVRGGGRKPWPQKGTGRARHGSIRSPIWVGGGVSHGPRKEKRYEKKIPKKMKRKALFSVLSGKLKDKEIVILDKLEIEKPKTKLIEEVIKNLREKLLKKDGRILLALPNKDEKIKRASNNLPDVKTIEARNLNVLDLLNFKYLILLKDSLKVIKETFLK